MDVFFNINVIIGIGIFLMVIMFNMMLWFISITNDKLKGTNELLRIQNVLLLNMSNKYDLNTNIVQLRDEAEKYDRDGLYSELYEFK